MVVVIVVAVVAVVVVADAIDVIAMALRSVVIDLVVVVINALVQSLSPAQVTLLWGGHCCGLVTRSGRQPSRPHCQWLLFLILPALSLHLSSQHRIVVALH